ncbi:MAG: prohibitin family protein [Nitrospirae bacterium]|nr:prohibitin family protein [Nitrospirota bacterium]
MALNKEFDPLSEVPGLKKMSPFVIIAAILFLFWVFSPFVIVGAGERGVVFNQLHGVEQMILGEGFSFVIPVIQRVVKMDVRIRKSDTRATAASKDLQTVATEIVLNFHLFPDKVNKIYQEIGPEYEKRIIDPAVQEIVKAVCAEFTAEELITKRQLVKDEIKTSLHKRLMISHISLDELNITDFQFSKIFNEAIESKQTAEQLALKAQRDLERVKIEGQQKVVQAKAEAESQRIQKETISPIILQLRAIEKWDGKFPQVIGGTGAMPFINLDTGSTKK